MDRGANWPFCQQHLQTNYGSLARDQRRGANQGYTPTPPASGSRLSTIKSGSVKYKHRHRVDPLFGSNINPVINLDMRKTLLSSKCFSSLFWRLSSISPPYLRGSRDQEEDRCHPRKYVLVGSIQDDWRHAPPPHRPPQRIHKATQSFEEDAA